MRQASSIRRIIFAVLLTLALALGQGVNLRAQSATGGTITGTVNDATGGAVQNATVTILNLSTGLTQSSTTKSDGSFEFEDLPTGTYSVTFKRDGFQTEVHSEVVVQGNRAATVNGSLRPGQVNTVVTVTGVPLMNQTDMTNGYVVDDLTIQRTPLGTGSFTQLAILSPGVHADFLGGSGANTGLGNQAIFANGNRDTSNSFSLNGVSTNNLFNGNSTSQVGENRFVLNTGESFGSGGQIQTSTSVTEAIGQALPTPPPDAISEIDVNSSMYDASQGNHSGAQIGVITKSGTNNIHGSVWEQYQSSDMNATPYFDNAAGIPNPFLNRNQFGATFGGPLKKDKLFYFLSYQGVRIADGSVAQKDDTVPLQLTNDRSAQGITNMIVSEYVNTTSMTENRSCLDPYPTCIMPGQINTAAMDLLNAKLPNGQFLFPSPNVPAIESLSTTAAQITEAQTLGYDAIVQGPNSQSSVDQGIAGIDYQVKPWDRLSVKYYIQNDPTANPFGAVGSLLGFSQQLSAGSDVVSITNTTTLSPRMTWEQHFGFTRLRAFAATGQDFTASGEGMNLINAGATFPQFDIGGVDPNLGGELEFGPSASFGNAGMYQNQWGGGSSLNWILGRHTISIGGEWDHTQLNILNDNANTDTVNLASFLTFVEGTVRSGDEFAGSSNRYYRSDTAGLYLMDSVKVRKNLTVTAGLRWDYDGPLSEEHGLLTAFNPALYHYVPCAVEGVETDPSLTDTTCDAGTDVITNSGLEIAGNNPTAGTPGASDSLMKANQWGIAPRLGIAWSPLTKLTLRMGYGLYYDRGELFSELSPSAGSGFNGPFGVTLAAPFVQQVAAGGGANLSDPFGTTAPPPPPGTAAGFLATLPNLEQTAAGELPAGNLFGPFLFGGYDINNKLPYTQNWTFDVEYQASNNWMFEVGYVGNHGAHEVLPIPFNQGEIATASHPVNNVTASYGGTTPLYLDTEPVDPYFDEYAGNTTIRVPYPGYDFNSVLYEAIGNSNYNALQVQVKKRLSHGLQITAAYTWSHSLDEQSGLGLFFTGNNVLNPRSNYASSDFDQTHVFLINYSYAIPNFVKSKGLGEALNGWVVSGQTVAESGQPYSVYDYTGSVGSLYFGSDDEITNPIVPLAAGVTPKQAELQGTLGVNPAKPVLNAADFEPTFVAPGTDGVPACDSSGCDEYESVFGATGRNTFRGPFQTRFDMSLAKEFAITERYRLRFEVDAFNIFNHPDFDAPNNDVQFFANYTGPSLYPNPYGSLGLIQHTVGSPRFLQLGLHLAF